MRIAFNAQRLAGQRLGVGRYIEYLLHHMGTMLADGEEVTGFMRRPLDAPWPTDHPRIRPRLLASRLDGVPWENLRLRGPARTHDVLFCPAYTAPVGYRGRLVVATHSVNEIQPGAHTWGYRQTYARLHRHSARRADAVIVPAESTRQEVIRAYGVAPERISVVPQGADDAFRPIDDPTLLRETRVRFFGTDRPYLLFVGKCSVRRNIPNLLRAFARLRHQHAIPHGLVLFGPNHQGLPLDDLCRQFDIVDDVVQTDGRVRHHSELVPVYAAADLFVHPSEFEGWSMTTVEALACGTAVVAADRGGLGDVARGYALMVDDPTVDALAGAIHRVILDRDLHTELRLRARERGAALRWSETTRLTLHVLRSVASDQPPTGETPS